MTRELTRSQAERKKQLAATFMERIGQPDRAEEFEEMSVEDYAEGKGLRLVNPNSKRRRLNFMANSATPTKTDLQDTIDDAVEVLDDAYAPETNREEAIEAIGKALDILNGEDDDEEEGEEEEDLD